MAASAMRRTVSDDVSKMLENHGYLTPIKDNKRKISTSTLSPPSARTQRSSSSSPGQSVSSNDFNSTFTSQEAEDIEIPAILYSQETLEYIGFTAAAAARIWHNFVTPVDAALDRDFFGYAILHLDTVNVPDATCSSDDWSGCMIQLGINEQLRRAILLPEFNDIRFTATCKYWVLDAVEMVFHALEDLDARLRSQASRLFDNADRIKRMKAGTLSHAPSSSAPFSKKGKSTATKIPSLDGSSDAMSVESPEAPRMIDHHTMLWRAGDRRKAQDFLNEETGDLNVGAIATVPGDFSGVKKLAYWTPQPETADRYATWMKHKAAVVDPVITQVAVPETLIKSLHVYHLWSVPNRPRDEWRKIIWHSRRGRDYPDDLSSLEDNVDVFIGHIASGTHSKFEKKTHWNQIHDSDTLKVKIDEEEKLAIQWVFNTRKARAEFEKQCKGKVWMHSVNPLMVPPQKEG